MSSKKKDLPILATFIARRDTLDPSPKDGETFDPIKKPGYLFFTDRDTGEGILVCHGSENGLLPQESKFAIQKFGRKINKIYCCHPKIVRRCSGESRIVGLHDDKVEVLISNYPDSNYVIVNIQRKKA